MRSYFAAIVTIALMFSQASIAGSSFKTNYFDLINDTADEYTSDSSPKRTSKVSSREKRRAKRCIEEYRYAKQTYLSEKLIYERTKDSRHKDLLKGVAVTLAGLAGAIIGHNKNSDAIKYMSYGVLGVGTGYTLAKGYRYIKDGKLEAPRAPSYCDGKWDMDSFTQPQVGVYCEQLQFYGYDKYEGYIEYNAYICGEENIERYKYSNGYDGLNDSYEDENCVYCN